jgi:transcription elongation factor Elf1
MQRPDPIRCTYCNAIQVWSAEQTDRTMMGEVHTCPSCGQLTHTCDDRCSHQLDGENTMPWVEAEPLY